MRALRWHGRRDARVEDLPDAAVSEFANCLIEVALCGICGTDVAEYRSGPAMIWPRPHTLSGQGAPVVLGHELVGTLVEGASADGSIQVGDRVTIDACLRCGKCGACRRGDYHLCRHGGSVGLHCDGGFAPLVAVPDYTLVAVPDEVSDVQAALTEPFAVALHALDRAAVKAGEDVLIVGFGPIGAASALLARVLGATPHVAEPLEHRRARAEQLGLRTLESGEDLARRARRAIGDGGPPVVIDSTGVASVLPIAIECTPRGGRIVAVGLPTGESRLDSRRLTLFERSLLGSLGYRFDLPRVLSMVASGSLDPAVLVDATVPLEDAAAELEKLATPPVEAIKVMVQIR